MIRILGRTIACMALCLIHVCFFYGVVYKIRDFPLQADIFDMVVFLLSVVLMGSFLADFFKNRDSSSIMLVWSSMIAVLISGFSWPANGPDGRIFQPCHERVARHVGPVHFLSAPGMDQYPVHAGTS